MVRSRQSIERQDLGHRPSLGSVRALGLLAKASLVNSSQME